MFKLPFYTHEEHSVLAVNVLIKIHDVSVVVSDEFSQFGNDALFVRTMKKQYCRWFHSFYFKLLLKSFISFTLCKDNILYWKAKKQDWKIAVLHHIKTNHYILIRKTPILQLDIYNMGEIAICKLKLFCCFQNDACCANGEKTSIFYNSSFLVA